MMIPQEYKQFTDAWGNANEIMPGGKQLSPAAMKMVIEALKHYPLEHLLAAIAKHVQTGKFSPKPFDIIEIIDAYTGTGHVSADEAWAIALESVDEKLTVALTKEIGDALDIALPVLKKGDEIGARMTFKDAYNRILKTAGKPQWYLSLGEDSAARDYAIQKAVQIGRLTEDQAARYLPGPTDGGVVGKLLTGKTIDEEDSQHEYVSRLRGAIHEALGKAEEKEKLEQQRKAEEAIKKRQAVEERRQELLKQTDMLQLQESYR
jgi:hypothetical protein